MFEEEELTKALQEGLQVQLNPELIEHMGDAGEEVMEIVMNYIMDTVRITTTVYLRAHCRSCIVIRILEPFFEWLNETGYKYLTESEDQTPDQFMRQVVVWTKEWTENEMDKPCTERPPSGLLH